MPIYQGDKLVSGNSGIPMDQKGVANGVATLGNDGKVPNTQLPEIDVAMVQAAVDAAASAQTAAASAQAAKAALEQSIVENPGSTVIDPTLSVVGAAAEAAAVGQLKQDLVEIENDISILNSNNLFDPIYKNEIIDGVTYTYANGVMGMSGTYTGTRSRIILQTINANVGDKFSINCNVMSNKPTIYIMNGGNVVATYRSADFSVSFEMPTTEVTIEAYVSGAFNYNFLLSLTKTSVPTTPLLKQMNHCGTAKYFGDLDYEAIGDSLTYGFTGSWNPDGSQIRIEKPYCEVVKDLLGLRSAINKGETGTTIANDLEKMGTYYPISNDNRLNSYTYAKVVSIMGGTNDWNLGTKLGTVYDSLTSDTFHAGWKRILLNLISRFATYGCFIFVIIPPVTQGVYADNSINLKFDDYIKATIEECRNFGVPYLDMSTMGRLSATNKDIYTSDGIHFNQKYTSQIFAPTVAEFIKQWFS